MFPDGVLKYPHLKGLAGAPDAHVIAHTTRAAATRTMPGARISEVRCCPAAQAELACDRVEAGGEAVLEARRLRVLLRGGVVGGAAQRRWTACMSACELLQPVAVVAVGGDRMLQRAQQRRL